MKLLQKARDEGRVGGTCPFSYKQNVSVQFGHEATAKSHGKVSLYIKGIFSNCLISTLSINYAGKITG